MRKIRLRDAKADLAAVVDNAASGKAWVITRRGKPTAVVLGIEEWRRLSRVPSLARLLVSAPLGPVDLPQLDGTPLHDLVRKSRADNWRQENWEALADANAFLARHGLWSDGKRPF
jgi:prevent-host-death family protein